MSVEIVSQKAPANEVWKIVRTVYRVEEQDDSVTYRITFSCPVCLDEMDSLQQVTDHVQKSHGVSLGPDGQNKANFQGRRVRLPNGEPRLVCPCCILQFPDGGGNELREHIAAEHGVLVSSSTQAEQSDSLDMLYTAASADWFRQRDHALQQLRVISLGSFCSMKLSIQKLGLGESHLPFDWVRTTSKGIRHFVSSGFQGFFSVATKYAVPTANVTMFRSEMHSFWHDDIRRAEDRQKLERRIERFEGMREEDRDLLFIRSCATTAELPELELLHATLAQRFRSRDGGSRRRVFLGIVIDGQGSFEGPFLNEDLPEIFIVRQPWSQLAVSAGPTYCEAVASIVSEALAKSEGTLDGSHVSLSWTMSSNHGVILYRGNDEVPIQELESGLLAGFGELRCFEAPGKHHVDCSQYFDECLSLPEELASTT